MKSTEFKFKLQLFADFPNTVVKTTNTAPHDMSPTMKTFYDTALLENSRETNVFSQFAKKQPMKGNKVEWRKFDKFEKATTPIQEGVIPTGSDFGMTKIEADVNQYGDYTTVSDRLKMEAYDDVIFGATEEMGAAMGETRGVLTRNAISTGTSVWFAGNKTERGQLTADDKLTDTLVNKAATWLKKNGAPKIDGSYIAFIHPCVAEDLRESDGWKDAHKYAAVKELFNGEIGELHGIRFIETNEARITQDGALIEEGGTARHSVFETLFFGKDAYGEPEPEGEGQEMIIKPASVIGGPLEQFSTIGYKFCHAAKILYQERILRMITSSSYSSEPAN